MRLAIALVVLLLMIVAAACGRDGGGPSTAEPSPATSPPGTPTAPEGKLTALERYNRGVELGEGEGRWRQAIGEFDKAIELDPDMVEAYRARGSAHHKLVEYDQAIADYQKAVGLDPGLTEVINVDLALAYFDRAEDRLIPSGPVISLSRFGAAIADFEKAIKLDPNLELEAAPSLARAHYERGRSYALSGMGSLEEAKGDFEKVIELDPELTAPDISDLYKWWEGAYHRSMDVGQIIADMDNIIALDPDDAVAYAVRAGFPAFVGFEQAIADLEKAISLTTNADYRAELEGRLAQLRAQ